MNLESESGGLREVRLQKLEALRALGMDPYAVEKFDRDGIVADLKRRFDEFTVEQLAEQTVRFAGRIHGVRHMGKASFAHVSDGDDKLQIYVRKDDVGETQWEAFNLLDVGDHLGVTGYLFITRTGEQSLHVKELLPLSKCLEPLPIGKEKDGQSWYGLSDVEQRYRHRHLDLVTNREARQMLIDRSRLVSAVRRYFDGAGYLEVETPMLQVVAGGAAAKPFVTHFNAYEMEVKLRISLELYLKRLICGDLPAVYEIGRVFRNEKVSFKHNPEFTLLEFYEAYTDLEGMMRRVEELFAFCALQVYGTTVVPIGPNRVEVDFAQPWERVDLVGAICEQTGLNRDDLRDLGQLKARAAELKLVDKARANRKDIKLGEEDSLGGLIEKLLEVFVEPLLQKPSFVVGYPIETSPLAKKDPSDSRMTRRFEGYVLGREICNAFSEINDPIDQRERFEQQASELAKGDEEAHPYDHEFLYALECGMPPTGGCGIGMERLAMIFTGAEHIREIMLFPFMRPVLEGEEAPGT